MRAQGASSQEKSPAAEATGDLRAVEGGF